MYIGRKLILKLIRALSKSHNTRKQKRNEDKRYAQNVCYDVKPENERSNQGEISEGSVEKQETTC